MPPVASCFRAFHAHVTQMRSSVFRKNRRLTVHDALAPHAAFGIGMQFIFPINRHENHSLKSILFPCYTPS